MKITLKEIKEFFNDYEFSTEPLELDICTTLNNQKLFVDSMIKLLEHNSGKRWALPYYNHLLKYYKYINHVEKI